MITLILFYLILLFILVSLPLKYVFNNNKTKKPIPPGKTGWPLIGETWTYASMAKKDLVYQFIADRKLKYSDKIFRTSLLGHTMAIMCSPEGNKFLFSNENKLVRSWWPSSFQKLFHPNISKSTSIQTTKKALKILASTYLRPDSLQEYVGTMDLVTKKSLELQWRNQKVVKAHALVQQHVFALTCRMFMSVQDYEVIARLEKLARQIGVGLVSAPIDLPGSKYRQATRASVEFCKQIVALMKQRKIDGDAGKEDLMSHLMCYTDEDGESFTEQDVANKLLIFVFAAYSNTIITIVSLINYLAELPEVYHQVFKEQMEISNSKAAGELLNWEDVRKMTYSWNVVKETLRLSPPQGGYREALSDFHYEGYYIPKGWKIHWNAYAVHRNPEYFPDPDKFKPSRFEGEGPVPYSFVPFGGGPRMCPGNGFARVQILVFIHNLVTNFRWEKVYPDEKIVCDPILSPTKGLPIRLYPHKH